MAKELKIRITGDASGLKKATDESEGIIAGFGSKVSAFSVAAGNLLADGIKTGVSAAAGFLSDSIGAASDMGETISKVGVLFGDSADWVEKWAGTASTSLGQSKQQALDAAATFATFGKGAGLTGDELGEFSTNLASLASDMASFSNATPEEAIGAIGAALRGESEPIRAFGVLLDDATLREEALKLGLIETTKEALTPAQKVLAAQEAIYRQTTDAQGDFARTSGGLANQQRILAAQVENLKAKIGEKLLPVVLRLTQWANDKLIPTLQLWGEKYGPKVEATVQALAGWFQKLASLFQGGGWTAAAGEVGSKLMDGIKLAGEWLGTVALPWLGEKLAALGRKFGEWVTETAIPYLQANLPVWLQALGDWLQGTALPWLGEQVLALAGKLGGWIADATGYLIDNLPGWLEALDEWLLGTALPWLGEQVLEFAKKLGGWISDATAELVANLPEWIGAFVEWAVGTAVPAMLKAGADFVVAITKWVGAAIVDLAKALPGWVFAFNSWAATEALPALARFGVQILQKLLEGVAGAYNLLWDTGVQVVQGLINGILSMGGALRSSVSNFISSNVPDVAKSLLGIGSPSRLFHEFGMNTAQGLADGMLAGRGAVGDAARLMAGAAFQPRPGLAGYTAADLAGGAPAAPGSDWVPAGQTTVVQIDGRTVATAVTPYQRQMTRQQR